MSDPVLAAIREQMIDRLLWRWGPHDDRGRRINAGVIADVVLPAVEAALSEARSRIEQLEAERDDFKRRWMQALPSSD